MVSVPTKDAKGQPNLAALICCIRSVTQVAEYVLPSGSEEDGQETIVNKQWQRKSKVH